MVMVDRVSLWDRTEVSPEDEIGTVLDIFRDRHPDEPTELIESAFTSAFDHHDGQKRKSGEAYITHPVAVAEIIADLGLDDVSIASALLHDTVEDTGAGLDEIEDQFGSEVATIVDGVTKLDRLQFDTKEVGARSPRDRRRRCENILSASRVQTVGARARARARSNLEIGTVGRTA